MSTSKGFTFIEVMIAMLIFAFFVAASLDIVKGSVKAVADAEDLTEAAALLKNLMVELETKIATQGLEEGCEEKTEARFPEPFERFKWTAYCHEVDFHLSETAAQVTESEDLNNGAQPNEQSRQIEELVLNLASDHLTQSIREIHAEIEWVHLGKDRKISATTHVSDLGRQVNLSALGISQNSGSPVAVPEDP